MNYVLTDTQQAAVEAVAKAELRSIRQTVGLLIAQGVHWMYVDDTPRYGDIKTKEIDETLMKECSELP